MYNFESQPDRLKYIRNLSGLSRKEFEEKYSISAHSLQSWELGRNQLSEKGAKLICQAVMDEGIICAADWLLKGNGKVPIIFSYDKKSSIDDGFSILIEIEAFKNINQNASVVLLSDDSLEPLYSSGNFVGGIKFYNSDIQKLINEICIVETKAGDTLVRKVLEGNKSNLYNLSCINPLTNEQPIISNTSLNYAAEVVWYRKKKWI